MSLRRFGSSLCKRPSFRSQKGTSSPSVSLPWEQIAKENKKEAPKRETVRRVRVGKIRDGSLSHCTLPSPDFSFSRQRGIFGERDVDNSIESALAASPRASPLPFLLVTLTAGHKDDLNRILSSLDDQHARATTTFLFLPFLCLPRPP